MKILHINQSDLIGGAAIAGYRLHQCLLQQGVSSKLLVGQARTNDPDVALVPRYPRIEALLWKITSELGLNSIHHFRSFDILKHTFFQSSDILNFHNLHSTNFSYLALPKLTRNKPTVFTLHDMWSFTGHCAYSHDCNRWQIGCGQCPYPESYPAIKRDNTHWEWKLKHWVYKSSRFTIVTPSQWLRQQVASSMLGNFPIQHIPNGIDLEAYQPLNSEACRTVLGIPPNKKVLLFCSMQLTELRKGGDLLIKALKALPDSVRDNCFLLTLGGDTKQLESMVNLPALHLSYVSSDRLKSIAYSAADIFILPTRADNLPIVLQESLACGTPMVSFKVGGVPDIVRPGITGYLAIPEDFKDLSHGIVHLLENNSLRKKMADSCRHIAVDEYSLALQAKRYINLYRHILTQ